VENTDDRFTLGVSGGEGESHGVTEWCVNNHQRASDRVTRLRKVGDNAYVSATSSGRARFDGLTKSPTEIYG